MRCLWKSILILTVRPSDGPNMLKLADLPALLAQVQAIDAIVRGAR